jgi:hypothetical protein
LYPGKTSTGRPTRIAALTGALGLVLAGCGGVPVIEPVPSDEQGLTQFAAQYRN